MNELLIPEDLLQLEKLKIEIELNDENISFLGIIGIDTNELMLSFNDFFTQYNNIYSYIPSSDDIFNEILNLNKKDKFILINLFDYKKSDFIQKLLFFRDFISDYDLKLFFILNKSHYNLIIKNAIDFYNVATFSYLFNTYKAKIDTKFDRAELDKSINEYQIQRQNLNKKQKINFLYEIGNKCNGYGDHALGLKYLLMALPIAQKVNDTEYIFNIKYLLGCCYSGMAMYNVALKYYYEVLTFYRKNKNMLMYKTTLDNLIFLYYDIGDYDKALDYIKKIENDILLSKATENKLSILKNKLIIFEAMEQIENDKLFEEAFLLAEETKQEEVLSVLYQLYGNYLIKKNLYLAALEAYNKALEIHKNRNEIFMQFAIYDKIGRVYLNLNDFKKAFIYCNAAYDYFKQNNNKLNTYYALKSFCSYYLSLEEYEKCLEKAYEAIAIAKDFSNKELLFDIYIYVNQIRIKIKEFDLALDILDKANKLNIKKDINLFHLYLRYADTYCNLKDIKLSNQYLLKAQNFSKSLNEVNRVYMLETKAEILVLENKYDEALLEFNKILHASEKINNLDRIISIEVNLAYLYKKMKNFKLSKRFFSEAIMKLQIINTDSKKINQYKEEINSMKTV